MTAIIHEPSVFADPHLARKQYRRGQGACTLTVKLRVSMTSSALSASPRKLSLWLSTRLLPPVSSSRSSARGASSRKSDQPTG